MVINYFALAVILWWISVCVHLYLALAVYHAKHTADQEHDTPNLLPANHSSAMPNPTSTLEKIQRDTAQWEVHFKVLCYAVPGAITLVLAMCNELGAGGIGQVFCWIKDDNEQVWQFAFFYVELGIVFTVGITLFGLSLRYVWTRDPERSMAKIWSIFVSMREGILFVVLFFLLFFWMLVYRIQIKAQYDEFGDAYSDWIECTIIRWANSANVTSPESVSDWTRCPNRDKPSYTMWISEVFCIAGMGVVSARYSP